jgi:hypothetical protein
MNIFEEVRKLNLPEGEYLVVGSGTLAAHQIREFKDIDLLVTRPLFEELRTRGWEFGEKKIEGRTRAVLYKGIAEAHADFWYSGKTRDVSEMIANAELIEGIPFLPLRDLLEIKRVFGRPKDVDDVALIENYMSSNSLSN